MYERFTDRARMVMSLANKAASRYSQEEVGLNHLLLGILQEGKGVACNVLKNLVGMDLMKLRAAVQAAIEPDPGRKTFVGLPDKLPLSPGVGAVVERSLMEADSLGNNYVGTEHLLLAMLAVCREVLVRLGIEATYDQVRDEIKTLLGQDGRVRQPEGTAAVRGEGSEREKVEKSLADRVREIGDKWRDIHEEAEECIATSPRMLTRAYRQEPAFADLVVRFTEARIAACPTAGPEEVTAYAVDLAKRVQRAITPNKVWTCTIEVPVAAENSEGEPVPADVPVVKPSVG